MEGIVIKLDIHNHSFIMYFITIKYCSYVIKVIGGGSIFNV